MHFPAFVNGIAVGAGGTIRVSNNGNVWGIVNSRNTAELFGGALKDNLVVALGAGGTILTSIASTSRDTFC